MPNRRKFVKRLIAGSLGAIVVPRLLFGRSTFAATDFYRGQNPPADWRWIQSSLRDASTQQPDPGVETPG